MALDPSVLYMDESQGPLTWNFKRTKARLSVSNVRKWKLFNTYGV